MDPAYKAGSLIAGVRPFAARGAHQIIDEIKRQIEAVRSGDLSRGEAMLVAKAEALGVLFYSYLSQTRLAKDMNTITAPLTLVRRRREFTSGRVVDKSSISPCKGHTFLEVRVCALPVV